MDPKLIGYLQRALSHEMTAVQLYLTQATLCELWGLQEAAASFEKESVEELEHAKRLTQYLLSLGIVPNGAQLAAVRTSRTLRDMLVADWHLEADAIRLYTEASLYCARIRNEHGHQLFDGLLQEERQHLESLESWLTALDTKEASHG